MHSFIQRGGSKFLRQIGHLFTDEIDLLIRLDQINKSKFQCLQSGNSPNLLIKQSQRNVRDTSPYDQRLHLYSYTSESAIKKI